MTKKGGDSPSKMWEEIKKRDIDEWKPTDEDIHWLTTTVASMKIGGKWTIPAAGITFEKVGQDHLRLEGIITDDPLKALVTAEKTKKVGERAAIKVDIEKAADYIVFHP